MPDARTPPVLVVEDEPLVRTVAVMYLQECGFSFIEARDADEAMLILRRDRSIAAVFWDVQMPGSMDGLALAQWLANTCPTVKVLLTSGRMVLDKTTEWRFLAKPYKLEDLEQELRSLLVARPES
jgi:two-component system, response regulator PdtaR